MVSSGYWQPHGRSRIANARHTGLVLQWKNKFGWIEPDRPIDHAEASKNNWRIYVNVSDVDESSQLYAGARVSFIAYSDGRGLGAEEVWLEEDADSGKAGPAGKGWVEKSRKGSSGWLRLQMPGKGRVQRTIEKHSQLGKGHSHGFVGTCRAKGSSAKAPSSKGSNSRSREGGTEPGKDRAGGEGGAGGAGGAVVLRPGPGLGPDRNKTTMSENGALVLSWASSEMRGWRPAMEDAAIALLQLGPPLSTHALFGVFDGHGGGLVSRRAAEELPDGIVAAAGALSSRGSSDSTLVSQALCEALPALDEVLRRDGDGTPGFLPSSGGAPIESGVKNAYGLMGSTAVVALVECDGPPESSRPLRIVVANLGDSRAVVCRAGEAISMSEDQKPDVPAEAERIERAGGFVAQVGPCVRIDGWGLNLSRALGDFHYKARDDLPAGEQKVSCVPEVCELEVTPDDEFLFLGCDGVFELHSNQDVVDQIRAGLQEGRSLSQVVEDLVDASCSPSLAQTMGKGSDNVSAMVILLQ
mmetsp:Transcript_79772/g.143985  ORF Transcript_79772/g.143985 Transcript_79772/m.143985 type:complete len:526 (+) Transcript_79772:71-1648(+)